ncbi:MAG: glycosyltransferase family 39 protein [Spirulinaceae cyanobacterium]
MNKQAFLRQWFPLGLILLLATGLYLYQLGAESLWSDEIISILDAEALPRIVKKERPLYYPILRLWMFFGESEVWLRGLSVLFGLASVSTIYLLGNKLFSKLTGSVAALLLALSPLFIFHFQEVRMYGLSALLSLGGTFALASALETPTTLSTNLWTLGRVLMLYNTPLTAPLLLPDTLLIGWRFRQQPKVIFKFGIRLTFIVVSLLPLLYVLSRKPGERGPEQGLGNFPNFNEFLGSLVGYTVYLDKIPFPSNTIELFYKGFALLLLVLIAFALLKIRDLPKLYWVAMWGILPIIIFFLATPLSSKLWQPRHLMFALPYLLLLLAVGLVQLWNSQKAIAVFASLIYSIAVIGGLTTYYTVQDRIDWRGVAEKIETEEQPGDEIAISADVFGRLFGYYYDGSAPINSVWKPGPPQPRPLPKSVIREAIEKLPPVSSRLWIIYKHITDTGEKQHQLVQEVIEEEFQVEQKQNFEEIDLYLVTPKRDLER